MNLITLIKDLFVEREDVELVSKVLAFSIYADRVIRKEEKNEAFKIIDDVFENDEYEVIQKVKNKVEEYLERYSNKSDVELYYEHKNEIVDLAKENENLKLIITQIFEVDMELHPKEKEIIEEINLKG